MVICKSCKERFCTCQIALFPPTSRHTGSCHVHIQTGCHKPVFLSLLFMLAIYVGTFPFFITPTMFAWFSSWMKQPSIYTKPDLFESLNKLELAMNNWKCYGGWFRGLEPSYRKTTWTSLVWSTLHNANTFPKAVDAVMTQKTSILEYWFNILCTSGLILYKWLSDSFIH